MSAVIRQLDAARKRISELEAERASMWVERKPIVAENIGATDRIAELELLLASANEETRRVRADLVVSVKEAAVSYERANRLSDDAGALRTELRDVKAELADALRKVERLERKAGKR